MSRNIKELHADFLEELEIGQGPGVEHCLSDASTGLPVLPRFGRLLVVLMKFWHSRRRSRRAMFTTG